MTSPVNIRHLEAETAAWPLWSEAGFRRCLVRLEQTSSGALGGSTQVISDELIQWLRPRSRGTSLEILRRLQDHVWFSVSENRPERPGHSVSLEAYLGSFAARFLTASGSQFFIRDGAPASEFSSTPGGNETIENQIAAWRWLSLALPQDLLLAAYSCVSESNRAPTCDHVSPGAEHMERFFTEDGIAQTHLHLGAAVSFSVLWTHLMSRISTDDIQPGALQGTASTPFGGAQEFLGWLVTAALSRLCLASFLWQQQEQNFADYMPRLARRGEEPRALLLVLSTLMRGKAPVPFLSTRPLLRRLAGPAAARLPTSLREIREADPLYRWDLGGRGAHLPYETQPGRLSETRLLFEAMRWLRQVRMARRRVEATGGRWTSQGEDLFERVFWQYVRIRNRTYRHLVQEPGTAGLDWFSTHFRRINGLRRGMEQALMSTALHLEGRGPAPLASLEVRTSPPSSWAEVHTLVRDVARDVDAPPECNPERGLVLHFLKQAERPGGKGMPYADPRSAGHACRFGQYFSDRLREAQAIETALERHPELLVILRGMDVCSLELTVPTWVFIPLFRRLRTHSEKISQTLAHLGHVPPFRFTMHVGEDFRRLAEGLRRIHEPLLFHMLGPGDRLGHAVALGLEPGRWASATPITRQPREERLDDLVWELHLYREQSITVEASRIEAVRGEVANLSQQIYGDPIPADLLVEAWMRRHSPGVLERLGYPFMGALTRRPVIPSPVPTPDWLLWRYLTDYGVYRRGQVTVEVPVTEHEVQMLRHAQRFLRRHVAQRGMTVEANPSSNMLIGDIPFEAHPIFALQPLAGMSAAEGGPVPVSIGDDDPITFANCLPDEFSHLYYQLIRQGIGAQDAMNWLEQVRKNGLRARFTLPLHSRMPERRLLRPRTGRTLV